MEENIPEEEDMAGTKSVSVRLPIEHIIFLEEISDDPLATKIKRAVKEFIEGEYFASFASFGNETLFVTVKKAAEILNISPQAVRKRCKNGSLNAIRPGKQWYILASQFPELLKPNVVRQE